MTKSDGHTRRDLVAHFTYFPTPDWLGADGDEHSLALTAALKTCWRASACRTWGEFAEYLGTDWTTFVSEYADHICNISGVKRARRTTRFSLGPTLASGPRFGEVVDPRSAAYDWLLREVSADVFDGPELKPLLDWCGESPFGHVTAVTSGEDGFAQLQKALHRAGYINVTLEHSEENELGFLNL